MKGRKKKQNQIIIYFIYFFALVSYFCSVRFWFPCLLLLKYFLFFFFFGFINSMRFHYEKFSTRNTNLCETLSSSSSSSSLLSTHHTRTSSFRFSALSHSAVCFTVHTFFSECLSMGASERTNVSEQQFSLFSLMHSNGLYFFTIFFFFTQPIIEREFNSFRFNVCRSRWDRWMCSSLFVRLSRFSFVV